MPSRHFSLVQILLLATSVAQAWVAVAPVPSLARTTSSRNVVLYSTAETTGAAVSDYEIPEDAVITIKPKAMKRLRELRQAQGLGDSEPLVLRMGVRSGGCSGG